MGTTSSTGTLYFTGVSTYSSDFQQIISRAVAIAQQPVTALQNEVSDNTSKNASLQAIDPDVAALGADVAALGTLASTQGLAASSSDPSTVSVINTGATAPATYTVSNISSLASAASETSLAGYTPTQSVSTSGTVNLVVGAKTYALDLTAAGDNDVTGLANAINGANAGVNATILTNGSNNYLVVSANNSGATTLQLNDAGVALISDTNQGSNASFELNGIPITQSSNNVTGVIPGVSFTLQNTTSGSASVTLSLASDSSQLSSALQSIVTDYNTLVTQVQAQQGPSAGPLGGDLLIEQISSDMQQLVTYWNPNATSSVRSLSDLGVTFSDTGQMSFDQNTFSALSDTQLADAFNFLGSSTTGFGALAANFTQLTDPISGLIQTEETGLNQTNTDLNTQIATLNAQVAQVQADATTEAQQADAYVAELQSQQNIVDASIQSLNYVLYGRQTNANGL